MYRNDTVKVSIFLKEGSKMSVCREKMKSALLEWVVPFLNEKGFKGTYPNYYRITNRETQLINFQFSLFVDSFCVNIAKCPPDGIDYKNEKIPPQKVSTNYCPRRLRLGAAKDCSEHWFTFNPCPYQAHNKCLSDTVYKDNLLKYVIISKDIISLLKQQAELWWRESDAWWTIDKPIYNKLFMDIQRQVNH